MATGLLLLSRGVHLGSGMLLVGIVAFRWLILLPSFKGEADETWWRWETFFSSLNHLFVWASVIFIVSGCTHFWATAANMSGTSLIESLNADTWRTVWSQTRFGAVTEWRCGMAILFAVMAIGINRNQWLSRQNRSALEFGAALIATLLFLTFALTGHAAATGPIFSGEVVVDASHLLTTAIWPAGLVPFALFLGHSKRLQTPFPQALFGKVVARFSSTSLLAVIALSLTGLLNACQLVGNLSALFTTSYGQVLCAKLALFGLILVMAAGNRLCFVPSLVAKAGSTDEEEKFPSSTFRSLRLFVAIEIGLAMAVVAVVSLLGITPPPDLHSLQN